MCPCQEIELSWESCDLALLAWCRALGRMGCDGGRTVTLCAGRALLGGGRTLHFCRNGIYRAGRAWQLCCQAHRCCSSVPGCSTQTGWAEAQAVPFMWQQPRRMSLELCETLFVFIYICTHSYSVVSSLLTLFHRG